MKLKCLLSILTYNLERDPGETTKLNASHPEVAAASFGAAGAGVFHGRSSAGPEAHNDIAKIKLRKSNRYFCNITYSRYRSQGLDAVGSTYYDHASSPFYLLCHHRVTPD